MSSFNQNSAGPSSFRSPRPLQSNQEVEGSKYEETVPFVEEHEEPMMSDAVDTQETKSSVTVSRIIPANPTNSDNSRLICTICKKRFKDPRLLPCLHSFCGSCVRTLDPYIVSSDDQSSIGSQTSLNSVHGKNLGNISILCPQCDVEVELPRRGPKELPIDFVTRKLLLLDALNPDSCEVTCDLCTDNAQAEARCMECMANVCAFCVQAHKRQRRTASHVVLSLGEAQQRGAQCLRCPVTCTKHPQEEIKMYCETCDCPVCRDCCLVEHREHLVEYTEDAVDHHRRIITNLIARLQPHIQAIGTGINTIDKAESTLNDHTIHLTRDINVYFDNYLQILQNHRQSLLKKVTQVCDKRLKSLQANKLQLHQVLADMQHSCDFSSRVLAEGDSEELLSVKPALSLRLSHLNRVTYQCTPKGDLNLKFKPTVSVGNVGGFRMYGSLENKTVDPNRCSAEGQGTSSAKAGESASLKVITYDNEGQRHCQGGENVTAEISANNKPGRSLPCPVEDNQDGTYGVKYTAQQSGMHSLSVCVNGTHIKGSPFQVRVKPTTQKHTGVWQCCTFCSSEGNKQATCACGGFMPGGFKGCGHGHPSHPGQWHWSCCASMQKESNHCVPVTTFSPTSTSSKTGTAPVSGGAISTSRITSGTGTTGSSRSGGSQSRGEPTRFGTLGTGTTGSSRSGGSLSRGEATRYGTTSQNGGLTAARMTSAASMVGEGSIYASTMNGMSSRKEHKKAPSPVMNSTSNQVKTISI
ncbi:E3 ubiquitin-protein ligase TRIM45-like isoform X2 [Amphiura filiformis]|uniref:E3 ubiquitin-protein ligase TRIM45-like isoform X2 n=1 Tax=Amphiura filiformis TaxID=82378 RepID=UPI003B224680